MKGILDFVGVSQDVGAFTCQPSCHAWTFCCQGCTVVVQVLKGIYNLNDHAAERTKLAARSGRYQKLMFAQHVLRWTWRKGGGGGGGEWKPN